MENRDHIIHLKNGMLANDTPYTHVNEIVKKGLHDAEDGGLIIHFHGGLVKYDSGIAIASNLIPIYKDNGRGYPFFFVWESGLIETLKNNLGEIKNENFFQLLWKRISKIVTRKIKQDPSDRAAYSLPKIDNSLEVSIEQAISQNSDDILIEPEIDSINELNNFEIIMLENELMQDAELVNEIQLVSNGLRSPEEIKEDIQSRSDRVKGSSRTLMDPYALDRLIDRPEPGSRGILSIAKMVKAVVVISTQVIKRFIKNRHHGFHATVVEEILRELYLANVGEKVWNLMKKDTTDSFGPDPQIYGGTTLIQSLSENIDNANPPRITLVGHSTGAIYISEFLDKASQIAPTLKFDTVFLAPASTFDKTGTMLEKHTNRIDHFRMFTMQDKYEKKDRLVPVIYPHSLLYFISGVLEGGSDVPIVGMQRFYNADHFPDSDFHSIKKVKTFLSDSSNRVIWSITDESTNGKTSKSQKHGDFDNDPSTLESLSYIIKNGF